MNRRTRMAVPLFLVLGALQAPAPAPAAEPDPAPVKAPAPVPAPDPDIVAGPLEFTPKVERAVKRLVAASTVGCTP